MLPSDIKQIISNSILLNQAAKQNDLQTTQYYVEWLNNNYDDTSTIKLIDIVNPHNIFATIVARPNCTNNDFTAFFYILDNLSNCAMPMERQYYTWEIAVTILLKTGNKSEVENYLATQLAHPETLTEPYQINDLLKLSYKYNSTTYIQQILELME